MTTIDTTDHEIVELDERESDGIRVTLVWNRETNRLSVLVSDERASLAFALEVAEGEDPYDVFAHPFAFAAFRGLLVEEPARAREHVTCA